MPILPFQNAAGQVREFHVPLEDTDVNRFARQTDDEGMEWKRVYEVPNMGVDTKANPFSAADYVRNTGSKKGTFGDLVDYSAEQAAKRAEKAGGPEHDKVKQQFYKDWSKKRPGQTHPEKKKEEANAKLKPYGITIK